MFGWRNRKPVTSKFHDWLSGRTPRWFEEFTAKQIESAEDPQKCLGMLTFGAVVACVGSFLTAEKGRIGKWLGGASPDAVAFELLAFSFYAVRESHLPTPPDPLNDTDPDELVEGYLFAMGALPRLVASQTGWDVDDLWRRRVMFYFQRPNMMDATEAFVGTLLTMKGARLPTADYGKLSLDLDLNMKLRLLVHTYASEMPKLMADNLQTLAVDHGLMM